MNQYILQPGVNDLLGKAPHLLVEWDYEKNIVDPLKVYAGSSKKYSWICKKGHKWDAVVSSRVNGRGCPYCIGKKVWKGFNDLETKYPLVAVEWDSSKNTPLMPSDVTPSCHRKVWWKGPCGHSYEAKVSNRVRGTGCPYCCGRAVLKGFNDLQSCQPELLIEWDYNKNTILPDAIHCRSNTKIWWKCKLGHEWENTVENRAKGHRCPYCIGKKAVCGINDFETMNPALMEEWDYEKNISINPKTLTFQSRKKVWWKCKKGHEWKAEIYERRHGSDCPVCKRNVNKHIVFEGINDLKTLRPDVSNEWDYERNEIEPQQVMLNCNKKVWWICEKGHHWRASVQNRTNGTGCPRCVGKTYNRSHFL